jgi:hypothetical protein
MKECSDMAQILCVTFTRYGFPPEKRFFDPQPKKIYFFDLLTQSFEKQYFWFKKNHALNMFLDLEIWFVYSKSTNHHTKFYEPMSKGKFYCRSQSFLEQEEREIVGI